MANLPPGFVLEGQAAPAAATGLPPGFQLEGASNPSTDWVTGEMSVPERLLAMYGRGVAELGQGIKQGALHAGGALGLTDPADVAAYDKYVREDAGRYEKDLGQRTGGSVLPMAAQLITTAPLGGVEAVALKGAPAAAQIASSAGMGALMGAAQPVTEGDYADTKALQTGLGAGLGGAANAGAKVLGHAVEAAMNPTATLLNPVLKRSNATPFAQESERLAQETGVNLTPAQVSGSKTATMAENMARQSIVSRDMAHTGDQARLQQLGDYWDKLVNGVSASDASPEIAGKQVQGAAQNMVSQLRKWRDQTAAEDFGKIRALTKDSATIQPENTNALLKSIFTENEGVGTPTGDALARFAKKQLENVAPAAQKEAEKIAKAGNSMEAMQLAQDAASKTAPAQGNLDKLMQLRSYLSKVAGGGAKISGDNQDRRIAAQLLGTIDQDIDAASETVGGDLGAMLKQANARYREVSQQIDSVHASPLGRILGEDVSGAFQSGNFNTVAPETVINKLSSLKPSELGVVRGLMEQDQPQAWQAFKRSYLEAAMEKAKAPPSEGANAAPFVPSKLVNNLGDAKKLEAVFSPSEVAQINNVFGIAKRLSDKTGYNFSGTAPAQEALGILNGVLSGGVSAAAKVGATALGSRNLARIMSDANGRAALLKLQQLPEGSAQARQLTAWLAANYGAEQP